MRPSRPSQLLVRLEKKNGWKVKDLPRAVALPSQQADEIGVERIEVAREEPVRTVRV